MKKTTPTESKKISACGIIEILVFAFSTLHLTFLLLCMFNVFNPAFLMRTSFSYIVSFVLLIVCLLLFLAVMLTEKFGKISLPNWLKIVLYIGFFVFTNIYYALGLFENFWTLTLFYVYLGFVFNIIALSVFYNTQKTDNGIIKTNNLFVSLFTFSASLAATTLLEVIISSIKILIGIPYENITNFISNLSAVILVSLTMSIIYYCSLSKSKKIINGCLVKVNK